MERWRGEGSLKGGERENGGSAPEWGSRIAQEKGQLHGALGGTMPHWPVDAWARKPWPLNSHLIEWVPSPDLVNKNQTCPIKCKIADKNEYLKNMIMSLILHGMYLYLKRKKLPIVYLEVKFKWVCYFYLTWAAWERCDVRRGGSAGPALKEPTGPTPRIWRKPSLMRYLGVTFLGPNELNMQLQSWAGSRQRTASIDCQ